ncbi:hypothetical protein Rhe02_43610 [Rhizocola hellebori]|uniref:Uncharacterized protein n=1 Tax=Rhizocola hellebori TaxID=1392758 RepID=A0A8J3VGF0_9ACTN|nr:hypothetical protein [Rhizocola hellebori]GIH06294.1 hypothetical protein Rhe02_43610 [Rhizocola hellebori]
MSGKRSSSPGDDIPKEETGWLDDLRKAKKSGDDLGPNDFTSGGTDRWAKLSALGDHDSAPAEPRPPRESAPRRNRAEGGEPSGRRRAAEAESMESRRARMEAAAANLIGRRAQPEPEPDPQSMVGRRARPEPEPDPQTLVGRRARPEPEPDPQTLVGRRARPEPEPEPQKLVGRRARKEPEQDALFDRPGKSEPRRRSAFSDSDPISPAPGGRGRRDPIDEPPASRGGSRRDLDEPPPSRGGSRRSDPMDEPPAGGRGARRGDSGDEPVRRRSPFGERPGSNAPVSSPPSDEPRRRSTFGDRSSPGVPEEGRRRSPFGLRPSLGAPVTPPPVEETRRRPFGDRSSIPIPPPVDEPRRRTPASPPPSPGDEPRRRSPFAPGTPARPSALKPPLNAEPEPIGPARPLRGAGLALGSVMGAGAPPMTAPGIPLQPGPQAPVRPHSPAGPPPPAAAAGHGPRAGLAAGVQAIRGARSEVRRQLREQQRLRMWTLIALVVAVVGALPFYFVLRAATRDPVITSLDALAVPDWAVANKTDNITGSRWCLLDCRYRERTADSSKTIPDTAKVYRDALVGAGWSPMVNIQGCEPSETPEQGDHSCWQRDEFTLDLTVSEPPCKLEGGGRRGFDTPVPTSSASPEATPDPAPSECGGSVVHIKVFNAIDDIRLRYSPEPSLDPGLDNLTDEDLNPSASPTP